MVWRQRPHRRLSYALYSVSIDIRPVCCARLLSPCTSRLPLFLGAWTMQVIAKLPSDSMWLCRRRRRRRRLNVDHLDRLGHDERTPRALPRRVTVKVTAPYCRRTFTESVTWLLPSLLVPHLRYGRSRALPSARRCCPGGSGNISAFKNGSVMIGGGDPCSSSYGVLLLELAVVAVLLRAPHAQKLASAQR